MTRYERGYAIIGAALAAGLASVTPAFAAWEMREFERPQAEKAIGLSVAAKGHTDVRLAIGCDAEKGSVWRSVAVVEAPDSKAGLGMRGDVGITFGDRTSRDQWQVGTTESGSRLFMIPDATRFARKLLQEEAAAGAVSVEIHGVAGKPVPLTFPLAGLAAKIDKLSERCANWDLRAKE